MLASFSGVLFIGRRPNAWLQKNLKYLTTFSAGVLIAIAYHLIQEVIHEGNPHWFSLVSWIALGILVVEILSRFIPKAHHHHGEEHDHSHDKLDARRMLLGDAMHNIGDGLLLVPAFLIDFHVGLFTALAIFIHEFVQEISEFFILKEAGLTNKQAFTRNFIVSATILLGVVASLVLTSFSELEVPILAFTAGGFIYIISRDLLPHAVSSMKKGASKSKHGAFLVVGILLMLAVNTFVGHGHGHEEDEHLETQENIALHEDH